MLILQSTVPGGLRICLLLLSKRSILTAFNASRQNFQRAASIQKRVTQAEAEEASDVGEDGERSVDPGALSYLHRGVEYDLQSRLLQLKHSEWRQ